MPNVTSPIIELENGEQIELSYNKHEDLIKLGIELNEDKQGELTYHIKGDNKESSSTNTFICPKGTSLKLVLADGTLALI